MADCLSLCPWIRAALLLFLRTERALPTTRSFANFRTWKRYTGGLAQDITIYDLKNNTVDTKVPHTDWVDTFPMWQGNTIYFNSDRGPEHHFNLYKLRAQHKRLEQLTHFNEFDVMWPSLGPDAIIFENAGYLYTFDIAIKTTEKVEYLFCPASAIRP